MASSAATEKKFTAFVDRNFESVCLDAKAEVLWNQLLKNLDLTELFPSHIAKCSLLVPQDTQSMEKERMSGKAEVTVNNVKYLDFAIKPALAGANAAALFECPVAIGSLRHVVYQNGSSYVFRVTEISELKNRISFELVETEADVPYSSVLHLFRVYPVTENDKCLFTWETFFSPDADPKFVSETKGKKFGYFRDLKESIGTRIKGA